VNKRANLLLDLARQHQTTAWEVYQMARLCVFGPDAVDNPVFDPIEELDLDISSVEKLLDQRPSIPELLEIWQHCHDVVAALAERQRDPAKRAKWLAALVEQEVRMAGLRKRLPEYADEQGYADYAECFAQCAETIHARAGFVPKKNRRTRTATKGRG
jgi:hypothetical protein